MKKVILISAVLLFFSFTGHAQTIPCPADKVCISQDTANKLFTAVDQLIAAKDTIAKLLAERGTSDVEIAKSLKVIEEWQEVDKINGLMQAKYETILALYEKTLDIYQKAVESAFAIIDRQEKQINGPKSGWQKFLGGLKDVLHVAVGILIGRVH